MFKAFDFIYDDVMSSTYNLKLLRIEDGDGYTTGTSIPSKSFTMVKTNRSTRKNIIGCAIDDTVTFKLRIAIDSEEGNPVPIPRNCVGIIRNWLFNKTEFKKLRILQDDLNNCYYNAVFTEVTDLMLEGEISGFETTVITDNTGMYRECRMTKTVKDSLVFNLLNESSNINPTYPVMTIDFYDSDVTININGRETIFKNIYPGSRIVLNCETLIISNQENDLYNGNFNYVFPEFNNGKNIISITGSCKIIFDYNQIVEVGV